MSDILITGAWRSRGKKIAKQSGKRSMAIAYITSDTIPVRRGDLLICDASSGAIKSGNTSAKVLDTLHRRGVEVYSLKDLHAKTAVCGLLAIIGSANYSASSDSTLHEAVLVTENAYLRALALGAIGEFQSNVVRLTRSSINRFIQIPVDRRIFQGASVKKSRIQRTRKSISTHGCFSAYTHEDELGVNERDKIEEERVKWQQVYDKPDVEPLWFTMSSQSGLARAAKPGTVVLSVGKSGKRCYMDGLYTVHSVAKTKDKKRVILTCQEIDDRPPLPWGAFLIWEKKHHVALPKRRTRALAPHEYEILRTHPRLA